MKPVTMHTIDIATDASGDFEKTTHLVNGSLLQIRYVPDASDALATGADITIVGAKTGVSVLSLTNIGTSAFTRAPRQASHDTAGAASLYAGAGEPVEAPVYLDEPLTVTVAQGGNAKGGTLYIWSGLA